MSEKKVKWIVIFQQIVGGNGTPFQTTYDWVERKVFTRKSQAVEFGFKRRGSDDFNVGKIHGQNLIGFFWMDKKIDDPLKVIEKEIGL